MQIAASVSGGCRRSRSSRPLSRVVGSLIFGPLPAALKAFRSLIACEMCVYTIVRDMVRLPAILTNYEYKLIEGSLTSYIPKKRKQRAELTQASSISTEHDGRWWAVCVYRARQREIKFSPHSHGAMEWDTLEPRLGGARRSFAVAAILGQPTSQPAQAPAVTTLPGYASPTLLTLVDTVKWTPLANGIARGGAVEPDSLFWRQLAAALAATTPRTSRTSGRLCQRNELAACMICERVAQLTKSSITLTR